MAPLLLLPSNADPTSPIFCPTNNSTSSAAPLGPSHLTNKAPIAVEWHRPIFASHCLPYGNVTDSNLFRVCIVEPWSIARGVTPLGRDFVVWVAKHRMRHEKCTQGRPSSKTYKGITPVLHAPRTRRRGDLFLMHCADDAQVLIRMPFNTRSSILEYPGSVHRIPNPLS